VRQIEHELSALIKVPTANRQVKEENASAGGKDLAAALERIAVLARLGEEQKDQISHSQIQHEMVRGRSLILISSQAYLYIFNFCWVFVGCVERLRVHMRFARLCASLGA